MKFSAIAESEIKFVQRTIFDEKTSFKERGFFWQGKKASNPRPTVLETAALPAELFPESISLSSLGLSLK